MCFRLDNMLSIVIKMSLLTYLFLLFVIAVVSGMRFKKQPQGGVIAPGETVTLRCSVNQPYTTDVFWKNIETDMYLSQNTFIEPGRKMNVTSVRERYSIVGNHDKGEYFLQIIDFTTDDEGRYACEFFMNRTYQSRIADLRIATPPDNMYPICTMQPTGPYAVGDTVTLYCESVGGTPPASLALRRGSEILRIYLPFGNVPDSLVTHTFALKESDVNRRYTCVARHPALTNPRSCSFMPLRNRVGVYLRPLVAKAAEGEDVMFTCIAERLPDLKFNWYIDDVIVDGTNPLIQIDQTGQRLLFYDLTLEFDFALVSCEVIQVGPGYTGVATSLVSVAERPVEKVTTTTMPPVSSTTQGIPSVTPSSDVFSGSGSGDSSILFSTQGRVSTSRGTTHITGSLQTTTYRTTQTPKKSVPPTPTTEKIPLRSKVATDGLQDVAIANQLEKDYEIGSNIALSLSTLHPVESDSRDSTEERRSDVVRNTVTSQVPTSTTRSTEQHEEKMTKGRTVVPSTYISRTSVSLSTEYSEDVKSSEETSTYRSSTPIVNTLSTNASTSVVTSTEPLSTQTTANVTTNEPTTSQTDVSNEQQTSTERMSTVEPFTITTKKDVKDLINFKLSTETRTQKSSTLLNKLVSTEAFTGVKTSSETPNPLTTRMITVNGLKRTDQKDMSTSKSFGVDEDARTIVTTVVLTKDVTRTVTSKGEDTSTAGISHSTSGDLEASSKKSSKIPTTSMKAVTSLKPSTDPVNELADKSSTQPLTVMSSNRPSTESRPIVTGIKTTNETVVINATDGTNISSDISNTSRSNEILDIGNGGETQQEIPNDTIFVEKSNFVDPNSSKSLSFNQMDYGIWEYAIIGTAVAVLCISIITIASVLIVLRRIGSEEANATTR